MYTQFKAVFKVYGYVYLEIVFTMHTSLYAGGKSHEKGKILSFKNNPVKTGKKESNAMPTLKIPS